MRDRILFLAIGAAMGVLLLAANVASAGRISIDDLDHRVSWSPMTVRTAVGSVRCPVTLNGSFHSGTITKTVDTLIGVITSARVNGAACTGGRFTFLGGSLPWHVRYKSFSGTLPRITALGASIVGLSMQVEREGVNCLLTTDTAAAARIEFDADFYMLLIRWVSAASIDFDTTGFLCDLAGEAQFEGLEDEIDDGGGGLIIMRLI